MELDILLLTVYFICVGYVVYQMVLSVEEQLEDQVILIPNPEVLTSSVTDQLARQGVPPEMGEVIAAATPPLKPVMALKLAVYRPRPVNTPADSAPELDGQIMVQVLPQGPHPLQPVKALTVQVVNQTESLQVSVDWDRSSFTRMTNQTRRVIRHTPGMRLDLALPQVVSIVNPNQFLSTAITSEESFNRDPATQVLQIAEPLVDTEKMLSLPAPARVYSLNLVIQLMPLTGRGARTIVLLLPFQFQLERLPAKAPIPYMNWILKR
jgi:hypothetical protein